MAGCCAIILMGQSPGHPPLDERLGKPPSFSLAVAPLGQNNSFGQFSLQDWLSDNGSGGFPENFSDENRVLDEWETISPDGQ
ncbi:MAG: hypothetical protein ACREDW_11440 [Aestuariivirgaceae bacterium]